MRVLLFGATGMVGQGVLRACLRDPRVRQVQTVGRSATGLQDAKLREWLKTDFSSYSEDESLRMTGWDACFFCLGVASAGLAKAEYERITYGFTLAAASVLAKLNPEMTFVYVSGAGTDSTEQRGMVWARVKGKTENALLRLPFRAAYMFRPGVIEPVNGAKSRTRLYRILYAVLNPVLPALRRLFPRYILTTAELGLAMIQVAEAGAPKKVLESGDLRALLTRANRD